MELFTFQSIILCFPVLLLSLYVYHFSYTSRKKSINKGFKAYPVVGVLPEFLRNRHRFLEWTSEVLSHCPTNTASFSRPDSLQVIMTANPLNVEHILKTNFNNYPKGNIIMSVKDFLGQGILSSDGDLWKIQRKIASYEFNTKFVQKFVTDDIKFEISTRLVPTLAKASKNKQVLQLQDILEQFAFDNICNVAFNVDPACLGGDGVTGAELMRAFDSAATISSWRDLHAFSFLWKVKRFFNLGSERTLKKSITTIHDFAENIIRSRMEERSEKKKEDLLSRFMKNHENSPEFLRDMVISFILAGRDTTSSTLSWFFWLLSSRPDVERNILKELETIRIRNGKKIGDTYSFDELRDMHYLHAAISEALRLYPPVPATGRESLNEDMLPDGTVIKKGWMVIYHSYAMGRMENIWGENCHQFLPERWLQEDKKCRQESPFRFPAFHAGPRTCLGKDMAYIQMKSIAASIIERFEIDVLEKEKCPQYLLTITLRIKSGLPVRVKERCVDIIN